MGLVTKDEGWRIPDELWLKIAALLPPCQPHPLGGHKPPVPDRKAMNAIVFVLRAGGQGKALNGTGICSSSSAHRRFMEWTKAGVFLAFWQAGLLSHEELKGVDGSWLSLHGAITEARWRAQKNRTAFYRPGQTRGKTQAIDRPLRPAVE
jgi:transposase